MRLVSQARLAVHWLLPYLAVFFVGSAVGATRMYFVVKSGMDVLTCLKWAH